MGAEERAVGLVAAEGRVAVVRAVMVKVVEVMGEEEMVVGVRGAGDLGVVDLEVAVDFLLEAEGSEGLL